MVDCKVCHGEKVITYQTMLGVLVTAPCPKCNKPKDERDNALVKVQTSQARRQPFVDWTHSRSFNSWETAATFATAVGGKVMLVDKPTIGDVLNG